MDRTLSINRVPAGRVCRAEELDVKADPHNRFLNRQARNAFGRRPCGSARGSPDHAKPSQEAPRDLHVKLGCSEAFSIFSQTDLPGEAASCGRGEYVSDTEFFA